MSRTSRTSSRRAPESHPRDAHRVEFVTTIPVDLTPEALVGLHWARLTRTVWLVWFPSENKASALQAQAILSALRELGGPTLMSSSLARIDVV